MRDRARHVLRADGAGPVLHQRPDPTFMRFLTHARVS